MNSAILICTPNELGGIKTVGVDYTNFSKSDGQTGVKNNAPPPLTTLGGGGGGGGGGGATSHYALSLCKVSLNLLQQFKSYC